MKVKRDQALRDAAAKARRATRAPHLPTDSRKPDTEVPPPSLQDLAAAASVEQIRQVPPLPPAVDIAVSTSASAGSHATALLPTTPVIPQPVPAEQEKSESGVAPQDS